MAQTKAHKKKRRSQAPIALVYFITMIIFLFVIGMLALYALREFGVIGNDDSDSDAGIKSPVYNTLFARVNSKGRRNSHKSCTGRKEDNHNACFSVHSERKPDNA